ncbi:MAG: ATP-binding protein, partial [Planctomycetota bacterium]
MKTTIAEFILRESSDVAELVQRAKVLAALTQLSAERRNELAEAVSVVCRTIAAHGGKGKVRFALAQHGGQRAIEVSVCDLPADTSRSDAESRPGSRASRRDSWEASVIQRVGELVDHFESSGWPVPGSVVRIAQALPPAFVLPSESEFADWARMLQSRTALDALTYALRRARSLEKDLGHARCQQQLRSELGQRLSESDHLAMLALVISKTKNAISILDPDGTIVSVNAAFVQMTGYQPAEAIGEPLCDLVYGPDSDAAAVSAYRRALENGEELTQDILQYRKDGHTFWVESDLIPVRNTDGELAQWIVIETDITRRRETEESLRAAKETAEKGNRLKSEFLANMSHEIRTPMNAIIGMTELALATDLTDQQEEYLRTIRSSSESLLSLLNDVLDLSKIEAGRMDTEEIDFDLRELVQSTIRTFMAKAREKGLTLTAHLADDLPRTVRGDPTKLRQVLMNLIGNAIKFTAEGEVTVTVEEQWHDGDDMTLHLAVRDTGIGIPKEKRDEVFQAFRQSDTTTTRQYGGSGLGLTISAELVRMMRGRIWVDSTLGRGSIFHFTVQVKKGAPLTLPPTTPKTRETPASATSDRPGADWKSAPRVRPLHILIADDHVANRQLVTTVLSSRGHFCTEAADGQQAIDAWRRAVFDVLLIDVQMPVMDGFQVTAAIRKEEETTKKHVPIVALTAHAMAGDREKCLSAGMDAYLAKPLRPQRLVELIESVASLKPQGEPAETPSESSPREQPGFDLDHALQSLDNDNDLLLGQMKFFLQDTPGLLTQLEEAIEADDARSVQLAAHRLKGTLARYAYQDAVATALELENKGKSGQLDGASQL